ncbi:MAG: aminopeptidase P family protein [Candidatus Eisenbacteria bacterium]|uniref:Aminopeptidase P family protein n=1 Tax=Eiseniibacteriota bacterium TaxID=2212470 RepID=A0A938BQQ3_UNCEI|nr:aminopeptidase P family protein [Candidatus Eisenbacteria bacterium]
MMPLERHRPHLVPPEEIHARIAALQSGLDSRGLALAWIDHLTDRYYYTGSAQEGVLLVPASGEPRFFVRKSLTRARSESPLAVAPFPGRSGLLAEAEAPLQGGRLGLALDVTPAPVYLWLSGKLGGGLEDLAAGIRAQKAVKSAWEIEQIRRANEQATAVFADMDRLLRPEMTELELSAAIEMRLRLLGHSGTLRIRRPGLELGMIFAVSGDGGLYPTSFDGPDGGEGLYPGAASGSGWKRIAAGETVMVDIVGSFNGYQADTTRCYCVGRQLPEEARRAHAFCQETLERLETELRPGRRCADIYEETLAWAQGRGLPPGFMGHGENRVKFFGHGVGLDLDEFPILAARIEGEIRPGMVVAMEPKAFLPGIGPVGVENTYVVTDRGVECLCPLPREIRCVG